MAKRIDTTTARRNLPHRREPFWHKLGKGQYLGFRNTPSSQTWIARTMVGDKKRYQSLGTIEALTFEDATKKAAQWFTGLVKSDGARIGYTVANAVADYCTDLADRKSPKAGTDARQRLGRHLSAAMLKKPVADLDTPAVRRWHRSMVSASEDPEQVRQSKDSANRVLSILKATLNHAWREGVVTDDSAWRRVQPFPSVGAARRLFLTEQEVSDLLRVTDGAFHDLLQAAVFTGARYGELAGARVRDFDRTEGTLHLSGKTGSRDVYLSGAALAFFAKQAKGKTPAAWLLPKDDGTQWGKAHAQRPMKKAVAAAELPAETVFYSLRHYHISRALLAGLPVQIVAENCGTSIRMIELHYGKFMKQDRRALVDRIAL